MSQVVVSGVFQSEPMLQKAKEVLRKTGVPSQNISVVKADRHPGQAFDIHVRTKWAYGVAGGFLVGGLIGAIVFAIQFSGTLASKSGYVYYSGTSMSLLIGFAIGAALGALAGVLIGNRAPLYQVAFSKDEQKEGSLLLGVKVEESEAEEIDKILKSQGARQTTQLDAKYEQEAGL